MARADELQYRELILLLLNSDDARNNTTDASIERRDGFIPAASALCYVVISVPCIVPDGGKVALWQQAKIGYGLLAH